MSELKGPAHNQIVDFIKNKKVVEFHTVNSKVLTGTITWYDHNSFGLKLTEDKEITICKSAVVYYSTV